MTDEERILQFAAERLRPGAGETVGGALQEAVTEWWRIACPGERVPSMVAVAKVLTEQAGIVKERRGGKVRYSAGLVA